MVLAKSLGGDIRDYIKDVLGQDVIIAGVDGICIASSDEKDIGSIKELPENIDFLKDYKIVDAENGDKELIIPLKFQNKNEAVLVLKGEANESKKYVPLIKSFAELLIQQYFDNNKPVLDSTDQFITKLLNNASPHDLPLYESEAKVLGYNLDVKRIAIVIHLKDFWDKCLLTLDQPSFERDTIIKNWKKNIENNIRGFFTKSNDMVTAYIGSNKFVVFKAIDEGEEQRIKKLLKSSHKAIFEPLKNIRINDVTIGFGNSYSQIGGLLDSYKEADLALELGMRLGGENKSYFFGDLGILCILADGDREKKTHFANQMLSSLSNKQLCKTLDCFFEQNLNLTDTALKMGIHRNTVIYRLNQIAGVLNLDPRIFDQAVTIKIALLIKKLFS